ncbi:hypothetical protein [Yoonia sp.]|uniref:hypothetical protein n=1 Tax=Yoonia sp. TaxID=2212373 RepID=UPI0040486805
MTTMPYSPACSTAPRRSVTGDNNWPQDRLAEARAVIADLAQHSDNLIRLACKVLAVHGDTAAEREGAQRLLVVIDARRPVRDAQREDNGRAAG